VASSNLSLKITGGTNKKEGLALLLVIEELILFCFVKLLLKKISESCSR
jgi:hypothetical protein